MMNNGFVFPGGEARIAAEFAREAEAAGWRSYIPADIQEIAHYIEANRPPNTPYDIVVFRSVHWRSLTACWAGLRLVSNDDSGLSTRPNSWY